jgi:exodeoxyribonuclease VII large subunit
MTKHPQDKTIFTVSQLNQLAHSVLADCFSSVWVEGEISNFICANSKHWYFSLKDRHAQVRCVMFYSSQKSVKFKPENGMHVLLRASASLYENRGDFQLIVDHVEEIGFGALQRAFEQLKLKLQKEGLFDESFKKPLPTLPKRIGVITSPTGAAIRDVLSVLKRRFPLVQIIIYPSQVQGKEAANELVQAIQTANTRCECDVLILCRGGGSIEDLWPFNEEIVARAIFASDIPIISGVGHEIDFTIADFVADQRAPTPSAAAEIAVPDLQKLLQQFTQQQRQLIDQAFKKIEQLQLHLNRLNSSLILLSPQNQLRQKTQRVDQLEKMFLLSEQRLLEKKNLQLENVVKALNAMNPLAILQRGFSVLYNQKDQVIRSANTVQVGDSIKARLSEGTLQCTVDHATTN